MSSVYMEDICINCLVAKRNIDIKESIKDNKLAGTV